jgi:site-specific DNA-methyltransferase (adenine-specific)
MAVRLMPMRRVLADTGSIYLHCDPTASHYLKLVMDAIFGQNNFRNEIVWSYRTGGVSKKYWPRKHDIIFFYRNSAQYKHNPIQERVYYDKNFFSSQKDSEGRFYADVYVRDVWEDIKPLINVSKERHGYPTQKPLKLLERIITASSNEDDLVLDPFCGCGTAVHAAEMLGRRWIGIDISAFAVGLMRGRILRNFEQLTTDDVLVRGVPVNSDDAKALAARDKFEFEKWVCGAIGAEGMFHDPGARGADGGVDGVLKFFPFRMGKRPKAEFAIVQVKGGHVTADSVKALKTTVDRFGATAGVMVCFNRYMRTVENQRVKATFSDDAGTYPVIQGLSVEDLLLDKHPDLPLYGYRPQGGRVGSQAELLAP